MQFDLCQRSCNAFTTALRGHHDLAAYLCRRDQAGHCGLPVFLHGLARRQRNDVIGGIAQRAQRLAFGELDWLVEFQGPGQPDYLARLFGLALG